MTISPALPGSANERVVLRLAYVSTPKRVVVSLCRESGVVLTNPYSGHDIATGYPIIRSRAPERLQELASGSSTPQAMPLLSLALAPRQ
jgi:hypothetical protein